MHAWEAVQKTLDVIEVRINEEISLEELADTAALSPFYYQRLFSRLVKKTCSGIYKTTSFGEGLRSIKGYEQARS